MKQPISNFKRLQYYETIFGKGGSPTPPTPVPPTPGWEDYGEFAEYLISDGTPHSVLDFIPKYGYDIQLTFIPTQNSSLQVTAGTRISISEGGYTFAGSQGFYAGYGGATTFLSDLGKPTIGKEYVVKMNKEGFYINENKASIKIINKNATLPFLIGTWQNGATVDLRKSEGYYKDVIVYDENGTLIHHYRPFYLSKKEITDNGGVVHPIGSFVYYDIVNNKVPATIGNWGGQLREYEEWVYEIGTPVWGIRNPSTAFIKTGVTFKTENQKKIISIAGAVDTGSLQVANGSQSGTNRSPYLGYLNGAMRMGFGGQSASNSPISFPLKQELTTYTMETFEDKTSRFESSDGDVYTPTWTNSVITGLEEYLFRLSYTGTYYSESIITKYQCWDDGVRVINYIPLVSKDGVVGMLDLDTRVFHRSATNTLFEAVTVESTSQALMSIGIEPTNSIEENITMLNEIGVSV